MLTIGVLFGNGVGALIEWDLLSGLCLIFPSKSYNCWFTSMDLTFIFLSLVLLAGIMFVMPESPYYLVTRGRETQARKSLQWLRGKSYDIEDEYREMVATHERQQEIGTISLVEFCTKGVYLKPGLIMVALMFFQQYSGINAVLFYLTDIFNKADVGLSSGLSATLVTLVQVCNKQKQFKTKQFFNSVYFQQVIATGIAVLVVEKFGRKLLLILSAGLMCASITALGAFFYLDENKECEYTGPNNATTVEPCDADKAIDPDTVDSLGWLPLTSLMVYIFAFSIGFGPIPWMMNGEFFSLESKALASTIACAFNWFCAFMVSKFEVNIENAINTSGAYWLYGSICAIAVVFILFLVPETRGKTPEEMKAHFAKKKK